MLGNKFLSCLDRLLVYRDMMDDAAALFKGLLRASNLLRDAGQFANCLLKCVERFLRCLRAVVGRFCVRV